MENFQQNYTQIKKILENTNNDIYIVEDFKNNILKSIKETPIEKDFDIDLYATFLVSFIELMEKIEQKTCEYEINEMCYINDDWNYTQKINFSKKTLKKEYKTLFPSLEKLVGQENSTKIFISHLFKILKNNKLTLDIKEKNNEIIYEIDILSRLASLKNELESDKQITQSEITEKLKPYNKIINDFYKSKEK